MDEFQMSQNMKFDQTLSNSNNFNGTAGTANLENFV